MDELKSAAERFGALDHAPVGMCVVRKDFLVLFWNRCLEDWTKIAREAIVGTNLTTRFPRLCEPLYRSRIETVFSEGTPAIFSSHLHTSFFPSPLPGGRLRIQHTTVTSAPSADAKDFYALFAVEDVSELTRRIGEARLMRDKALEEVELRKESESQLRQALGQVKTLRGIIPICASCKRIRDDRGYWNQVDVYLRDHSEAEFSHGLCTECIKKLYPDIAGEILDDGEDGKPEE